MSATIAAPNFESINIKAKSLLAADAASGASSITVQTVTGLATSDFFYFGNLDQGTTEKAKIQSMSGTTVTLVAACLYAHTKFEDVTAVNGDQIRFYRAANVDGTVPADGSFAALTIVNILQNSLTTLYTDPIGSSSYWYKFTYYNSLTTTETDISQSVAVRGADYGHYVDIDAIRVEAGLVDVPQVTDIQIALERDAAESLVNGILRNNYALPLPTPLPLGCQIIPKVVTLLAAGYLLNQNYSVLSPDMSLQGEAKVNQAMAVLDQITIRELVLTDILNNTLLLPNTLSGWPDDTTKSLNAKNHGGDTMFRISQRF